MPGFGVWAARWWMPVVFIIVAGHLTNVCVTLFLHRSQTHRGVRLHYIAALPMRLWLWLTTAIVTKEWVACHRKHHAFADREGDPHSPLLEGLRNIVFKGAFYYRRAIRQPGMLEKYGKGTPNDWIERALLSRLNWLGIVIMLVLDVYLFGFFVGPLVWAVQMMWIPFWAAGIVNGVGHALGYRNFPVKDESRNITPIAKATRTARSSRASATSCSREPSTTAGRFASQACSRSTAKAHRTTGSSALCSAA
jgi:stearoyl-CoA desaturase (delta-9 desaturase)